MRDPIHPGETLREELDALGMGAAELARRIEIPADHVREILDGQRAITGETALRLGRFFGTTGEFWLNLQKLYEVRRVEQTHGAAIARGLGRDPALGTATGPSPANPPRGSTPRSRSGIGTGDHE